MSIVCLTTTTKFEIRETNAMAEGYVLEHESSSGPLNAVKRGGAALQKMGKA